MATKNTPQITWKMPSLRVYSKWGPVQSFLPTERWEHLFQFQIFTNSDVWLWELKKDGKKIDLVERDSDLHMNNFSIYGIFPQKFLLHSNPHISYCLHVNTMKLHKFLPVSRGDWEGKNINKIKCAKKQIFLYKLNTEEMPKVCEVCMCIVENLTARRLRSNETNLFKGH